jgi:hypothetical protein
MLSRTATLGVLLLLPLLAACQTQGRGGLEGWTLDTPEQAFRYFQEAAKLERYDLEYDTFSPEFIERNGGFTKDDYLRGRPLVHGEMKRLLDALLAAEIEEVIDEGNGVARLELRSGDLRSQVWAVRRTYYRLGIVGLPKPIGGTREDLRHLVRVEGDRILVDLRLSEAEQAIGMPTAEELTRVEVADRWCLLDVGRPFTIEKTEDPKDDANRRRGTP